METGSKHQREYFDKIADTYSERSDDYVESLSVFKRISSRYIKGRVLDVGNGGTISFEISKAEKVVLLDIAKEAFNNVKILSNKKLKTLSKKQNNKVSLVIGSALKLPFKDNSFDVVIMNTTAHHLSCHSLKQTQRNIKKAIKEVSRVLKKDGTFIFLEVCPPLLIKCLENLFFEIAFKLLIKFNKPLPYFLTEGEIKKQLANEGLKILKIKEIHSKGRVYIPLLPFLSPPGWLWDKMLMPKLFIAKKSF